VLIGVSCFPFLRLDIDRKVNLTQLKVVFFMKYDLLSESLLQLYVGCMCRWFCSIYIESKQRKKKRKRKTSFVC